MVCGMSSLPRRDCLVFGQVDDGYENENSEDKEDESDDAHDSGGVEPLQEWPVTYIKEDSRYFLFFLDLFFRREG